MYSKYVIFSSILLRCNGIIYYDVLFRNVESFSKCKFEVLCKVVVVVVVAVAVVVVVVAVVQIVHQYGRIWI